MTDGEWPRSISLSIVIAFGLAFVWILASWTVLPVWESVAQANKDGFLIEHLRTEVAERPAYEKAIFQESKLLSDGEILYSGSTAELASAQLQNKMLELVSESGGQVESSAIATPQPAHGLVILAVNMNLSMPQGRIATFLNLIELQKPYLTIQSIELRSTDSGAQNGPLDVQIQIDGLSEPQ